MSSTINDIAATVIRTASRSKPADAVLRETLKRCRGLAPQDATTISRAVFTYYRWQGWIERTRDVETALRLTQQLAKRFQDEPTSIPAIELRARAIPAWTAEELEVLDDWLSTLQAEPILWLRARRGQGRALAERLKVARTVGLPDAVLYEGTADLFKTAEFHAGDFEIQDIASQLAGWLCDPQPGEFWWDACAGEGGKTLHLSDLMQNRGLIWSSDRTEWRLKRLKRRAARAGVFNYRAARWDGSSRLPTRTKFDGVLLDAPCSGVGTWQRNPHARWTTTREDVRELAKLQMDLLTHAAAAVKPGGRLIYSVCTPTRAETSEIVQSFIRKQPEFEPLTFRLPGLQDKSGCIQTNAATVSIWPQDWGGNGMFVAAWRRRG